MTYVIWGTVLAILAGVAFYVVKGLRAGPTEDRAAEALKEQAAALRLARERAVAEELARREESRANTDLSIARAERELREAFPPGGRDDPNTN